MTACVKAINHAIENGCKISFVKVKAHSGDVMNTSADKIARMSAKQAAHPESTKPYDNAIQKQIITMMKKMHGKKNVKNHQVMLNNDSAKVMIAA